jgi:predicted ATPase
LVLDNFEHLLPAVGLINDLLGACPGVKALVTSRETLRLRGEQVFLVPPLAVPDLKHPLPVETLAQAPAVALFVQRSRDVRPDFALTAHNAAAVAEIVARLDGLPLAIELAAARSRYLLPETLLTRVAGTDDGRRATLPLRTGGARDLPARQQTLRDTIAWSYALLEPAEQALFRRLALFAGGFDLAAADAVGGVGAHLSRTAEDGVAALLDKSLLYRVEPAGEQSETRFAMLTVLREFALELLAHDNDNSEARAAFVAFYAGLAQQAAAGWRSAEQSRWLDWLRAEEDNLRQALMLALSEDADPVLTSQGVAMLLGLDRYWRQLARITETRKWIERGLVRRDHISMGEEARLLTMAGYYAMLAGENVTVVMEYHEQGLALARRVEDDGLMIEVLEPYGVDAAKARLNDLAIALITEALDVERTLSGGMPMRRAVLTNILATVYYDLGEYQRGLTLLEEIIPFVRERGAIQQLCALLNNVSNLARKIGDFERDRVCLAEVWQLERRQGDTMAELHLLSAVAERVHFQGRAELSVRLHSAEQALASQLGFAFPPAYQR